MADTTKKLYCYVDENGQETEGRFFLVSVIVADEMRDQLLALIEKIEKEHNPGHTKWRKTAFKSRLAYIESVLADKMFEDTIYYATYSHTKEYIDLTVLTTAKAITLNVQDSPDYKATVIVDGLRREETDRFAKGLRQLGVTVKKVRGQRDESDALIRLADNMAGFIRDALEGKSYAKELYEKAIKKHFIHNLN